MSNYQPSHEAGSFTFKVILGTGLSFIGAITLDQWALIAGVGCSLVVAGHTSWRWWCEWQDRAAKKAAAAAEPWV